MRDSFDGNNPLGRGGDGIPAKVHGSSASVVGVTDENKFHASLSGNRFDHTQRQLQRIQNGALFNMKFQVSQSVGVNLCV